MIGKCSVLHFQREFVQNWHYFFLKCLSEFNSDTLGAQSVLCGRIFPLRIHFFRKFMSLEGTDSFWLHLSSNESCLKKNIVGFSQGEFLLKFLHICETVFYVLLFEFLYLDLELITIKSWFFFFALFIFCIYCINIFKVPPFLKSFLVLSYFSLPLNSVILNFLHSRFFRLVPQLFLMLEGKYFVLQFLTSFFPNK